MVPLGNTSKNVAISLFTVSVSLSYSGTHCVITPPGFRCSSLFEIFLRIQRRGAFHPRMDRIRSNDVELVRRGQNEVARIIIVNYRCADRSARDSSRRPKNCVAAGGMSFSISQMTMRLIFGMHHKGSRGHTCPESHDQHRAADLDSPAPERCPSMRCKPHVERFSGGLHFPADMEIELLRRGTAKSPLRNSSLADDREAYPHR